MFMCGSSNQEELSDNLILIEIIVTSHNLHVQLIETREASAIRTQSNVS